MFVWAHLDSPADGVILFLKILVSWTISKTIYEIFGWKETFTYFKHLLFLSIMFCSKLLISLLSTKLLRRLSTPSTSCGSEDPSLAQSNLLPLAAWTDLWLQMDVFAFLAALFFFFTCSFSEFITAGENSVVLFFLHCCLFLPCVSHVLFFFIFNKAVVYPVL